MRTLTLIPALAGLLAHGQVGLDRPLVLDAPNAAERRVEGLAPATMDLDLITVGHARSERYHWAATSGTSHAIQLTMDPPCAGYASGLAVRFRAEQTAAGTVTLNVDGLGAKRLVRGDGLPLPFGQLHPGALVEAVYGDTAFVLMDRPVQGCPPGFLQANDHLCIMRGDTLNMSIFNASSWCMDRGARLCQWDEYIHACTMTQGQMLGFADNWEWIDDTNDHTHTAVRVGRWNCNSLLGIGAVEAPNNYASVRCCYHIR